MKSKVYVSAYLAKGQKLGGKKCDTLVLVAADESDISIVRSYRTIAINRQDEGKVAGIVKAALGEFIDSLPDPSALKAVLHRTHVRGLAFGEQFKFRGGRRAPVMAPNPVTEEVGTAIKELTTERGIECLPVQELRGNALEAAEVFFRGLDLKFAFAREKRALMLALQIKNGSYAKRIDTLQKRHDELKKPKRKMRLVS